MVELKCDNVEGLTEVEERNVVISVPLRNEISGVCHPN